MSRLAQETMERSKELLSCLNMASDNLDSNLKVIIQTFTWKPLISPINHLRIGSLTRVTRFTSLCLVFFVRFSTISDTRPRWIPFRCANIIDWNLQDTQDRLTQEEDARNQLFQAKKKLEQELSGLKKDIEDLELALQKVLTHFYFQSNIF